MQPITEISTIAPKYDAILLDLWGVVHDGTQLYPGVHDALVALRAAGKKIIMVSNAPRRADVAEKRLNQLGIEKELYDGVITSGEVGYQWLKAGKAPWGKRYYYIGPPKDAAVINDLDLQRVDDIKEADFILNVGFGDDNMPVSEFMPLLRAARAQNTPMLCLNPDLEVVKITGECYPCAGAIAKQYEVLGGQVTWFGKPHAAVYDRSMEILGDIPKNRILMVGDSLETDMPGAKNFGIDSLLVTGGILKKKSPAQVAEACAAGGLDPTYVIPGLSWRGPTRNAAAAV